MLTAVAALILIGLFVAGLYLVIQTGAVVLGVVFILATLVTLILLAASGRLHW